MAFTPNSRVHLLDAPLDNTQKNQIHFTTPESQYNYFFAQKKHSYESVTYQRKDNSFRVNTPIDALWNVNYLMYQNENFTTKWFYAFITKMIYVSEQVTEIFIETDVYQTWLFESNLKSSFVVREHVADDAIGKHLIDEQLEIGEYINLGYIASETLGDNWNVLAVSDNTPFGNSEIIGNKYGNVVTGLTYYPFPNNDVGIEWLKNTIEIYTTGGKADAIVMIFTAPQLLIPGGLTYAEWLANPGTPIVGGSAYSSTTLDINKQLSTLDGYTPKNNKMHTFPFKMLYVSNKNGQSATYRYENFATELMSFIVFGSIMPNPSVMIAPNSYKTLGFNLEEGLILSGFPLCSWTSDSYTAWMAQNGPSTAVALLSSGVVAVGGAIAGNPLAVVGGAFSVANQLTQIYQAKIQPDQAKGHVGSGSLMYGAYSLDFYYSHLYIKAEYAKRIDDYFTMYGYKVNSLKIPETTSRLRWNYIQTIDVNIDGAIPSDDMAKLKDIYNTGVTLWHTPGDFLNYSLPNNIV